MAKLCPEPELTYEGWITALRLDPDLKPELLDIIPTDILKNWWTEGIAPSRLAIAEAENNRIRLRESAT